MRDYTFISRIEKPLHNIENSQFLINLKEKVSEATDEYRIPKDR